MGKECGKTKDRRRGRAFAMWLAGKTYCIIAQLVPFVK